ncbi:Swarming motility protein YbiA [Symbiodinium microadriaticum]|uniref:Swarming motility protein YbiA n=1 Tax=Symbiodinium microadriaticum TaxID=2951 RepID=A0A1Q9CYF2_SYMMI|nr:Swarming motility protein YbiA [Symbiodinium microadriaticum]
MSARRSWRVRKNGYQPAVEDRSVEHGGRFEDGAVERFQGPYKFLSNFFWSQLDYEGLCYPSVEHAFQAAKLRRNEERLAWGFTGSVSFGEAKRLGRQVPLREDWKEIREKVMASCLSAKFADPSLREKLLRTGERELIDGHSGSPDLIWGYHIPSQKGENRLGILLMVLGPEPPELPQRVEYLENRQAVRLDGRRYLLCLNETLAKNISEGLLAADGQALLGPGEAIPLCASKKPSIFGGKFARQLPGLLSKEECQRLIEISEAEGYGLAGSRGFNPFARYAFRCLLDAPQVAAAVTQRLAQLLPLEYPTGSGQKLLGVNQRLRFLKYLPGMHHADHTDCAHEDENGRSFLTIQLYLNTEFTGGFTIVERWLPLDRSMPFEWMCHTRSRAHALHQRSSQKWKNGAGADGGESELRKASRATFFFMVVAPKDQLARAAPSAQRAQPQAGPVPHGPVLCSATAAALVAAAAHGRGGKRQRRQVARHVFYRPCHGGEHLSFDRKKELEAIVDLLATPGKGITATDEVT